MKDLVCVVADRQIEATISALLDYRTHALGIRPITKEMLRHPEKDSGCYWRPTDLLRGYRNQVKRALVILDLDWDGAPAASGAELEFQIEERLSREGMGGWAAPVVIEPELEAWVFSASRHVDTVLGWQDRSPALREALETHGLWKPGEPKPADPKAALDWAVKKVGKRRDTPIYRELAQKVSTKRCRDRAFLRLGNLLRDWFPPDLSGNGDTEGHGPSGPHTNSVESRVKTKKKLIEVALPLDAINAASVREKSIRHGHPSTLHLWWARRPLAAARAVIFAQMVDDPSANPDLFPTEAAQEQERRRLFGIIERLVRWENINNEAVLDRAREEIRESWLRTCIENADQPRATELFDPDRLPAFHDPFAGGGALPLEAQRLGLEAYASDLNPVAVLINKAMIEIPPRFAGLAPVNPGAQAEFARGARWNGKGAQGLAEDVRYYGQWMRNEAEKRIGHLYPKIEITEAIAKERSDLERYMGRKLTIIAWLWARTVKSPNPAFSHVDVPLVSTFMLSTKRGKEAYVEPRTVASGYSFTVKMGKPETPGTEGISPSQGTKLGRGANFRCLMSGSPVTGDYIKAEGRAGRMGSRLMAVVTEGNRERVYLPPIPEMEAVARKAKPAWKPDVEFFQQALGFRIGNYGMSKWSDLFTPRQLVALTTFSDLVGEAMERVYRDCLEAKALALGSRASRPRQDDKGNRDEGKMPSVPRIEPSDASVSGVSPSTPFHRTHLPHFEAGAVPQHICFRLADSLPQDLLLQWEEELQRLAEHDRETERRRRIEAALDRGYGACWLHRPAVAALVRDALLHFDGTRYRLHEWVIMPNHVHVLATPLHGFSLSSIVHSWKSYTAKQANKVLKRQGEFWHKDYFDRFMRDEGHYQATVEYIHRNPVMAGLCESEEDWKWSNRDRISQDRGRPALEEVTRAGRPRFQDARLAEGGDGAQAYAEALGVYLGCALSKIANIGSSIASWMNDRGAFRETFARQAIPIVWDYAESNPFTGGGGSFGTALSKISMVLDALSATGTAQAAREDATTQIMTEGKVVSTDPPYYDNVGYADLSDFFYVWLRRTLRSIFPELFATVAVPKLEELVAAPYRHGGKEPAAKFFLNGMKEAIGRLAEQAHPAFPVTIYYAFKQAETKGNRGTASTGWETFLDALITAGFSISGTWPIRTEGTGRIRARDSNALASSIVLVCRRRSADTPTTSRREFLSALRSELPPALAELQKSNIAPVDLAQAAIGPGMAIFTRYAEVLEADGSPMSVRSALVELNRMLDESLARQEGDMDADTRFCVAWYEQFGTGERVYGEAEVLFNAKNTSFEGLQRAGVIVGGKGKVRLTRRDELDPDWDPATDQRITDWEGAQHLTRSLTAEQGGGVAEAARLVLVMGADRAERARALAYRLYSLADRKGWADEARAYNILVTSWPQIQMEAGRLAVGAPEQAGFGFSTGEGP